MCSDSSMALVLLYHRLCEIQEELKLEDRLSIAHQ
jgi:hypothetical protein